MENVVWSLGLPFDHSSLEVRMVLSSGHSRDLLQEGLISAALEVQKILLGFMTFCIDMGVEKIKDLPASVIPVPG